MAPNLFLIAKKAISPWKWCSLQQTTSKLDKTQIYFGREPIKGIYIISPKGKRYLVAIRPNRNTDVDRIFRMTKNIPKCDEKRELAKINNTPIANTTVYLQSTEKNDDSTKTGTIQVTVTEKSRNSLPFSIASTTSSQTSTQTTTSRLSISTNSSWSTCNKSPIVSVGKRVNTVAFILNNTGALPHQKSPFGKDCHRYLRQACSRTGSSTTKICQIDLNGYRFLAKSLQVEFNNILGRWMFGSEIKTRTIVSPMCKSLKCLETDMSVCDKTVDREMFCLDDGISWVVGGAKRKETYVDGECMYMVDEKMECMRRQTVGEVRDSRELLEERLGKVLVFEGKEEYVPLLKYLGVDFGYA
ncbi:hypothetical protein IFR05_008356 [Cadophora sp. M221]|nr:hypothetical protein IFR05_008356 [Cadophora sp. M221]